MICENCSADHDGKYGSGRFCSQKCSRGFSTKAKRVEINQKVSNSLSGRPGKKRGGFTFDRAAIEKAAATKKRNYEAKAAATPVANLSKKLKKKRILEEQGYRCILCGIEQRWNNQPLAFHLDHVNGDRRDNSRENLRMICPNCHSQTETYCGRNKGSY